MKKKTTEQLAKGIAGLGYKVIDDSQQTTNTNLPSSTWSSHCQWSVVF